jgi:hypothetical protein
LEEHCRNIIKSNPKAEVNVTLLATYNTECKVPTWSKFVEVIKRAMVGNDTIPKFDDFLKELPERIKMNSSAAGLNTITTFQKIVREIPSLLKVITHCEAALAMLALYPDSDTSAVKHPDGTASHVCKASRLMSFLCP